MKRQLSLLLFVLLATLSFAQETEHYAKDSLNKEVVVIKNDGVKYQGHIVSQDPRELLMSDVEPFGLIYIPLHEIREIRDVDVDLNSGYSLFSSRYFLTTNGLAMPRGSKYAMLNYYGPEAHFAVADDFTLGLMTSWAAIPLIGSAKYSVHFSENTHLSVGTLLGTLSWIKPDAAGILAYGAFTLGNFENNINLSAGYLGWTFEGDGTSAPLLSLAALFRIGRNIQFVGDSFIYLGETKFAVIVPGIRFERPMRRTSIQVGIGGIIYNGETIPVPVPLFSWLYDL